MAEDLLTASAASSQSPLCFLNKLPTKRLDAAIDRARQAGVPRQAAQTGGYTPAYLHLSNLPLLPLYSQAQHKLLAKHEKHRERCIQEMDRVDPDKNLTSAQKGFLSILSLVSGGGGIVSMKRWERRLHGMNVWSSNFSMQQNKLIVFTRWTVPTRLNGQQQALPGFVDVLEHRMLDTASDGILEKMSHNIVFLKVGIGGSIAHGKTVTLMLGETEAKGIKTQKPWTKRQNFDPCESITFVGDDGIVAMEIVARIQRACSTFEAIEIQKRFQKEWLVPLYSG
ncbi:hypothetical protein LTR67_011152 [Exophiala xenobiotica]